MTQERVNIFKSMKDIKFEDTISDECGVTMNDSVEARAIATVMGRKEGVKVTYMPAMIRIDGKDKLIFKMDEITEELGRPMTIHVFEISTSTPLRAHGDRRRRHRHPVREDGGYVLLHPRLTADETGSRAALACAASSQRTGA